MNRTDLTREELGYQDGWNARAAEDARRLDEHIDTLPIEDRARLRVLVDLLVDDEPEEERADD